MQEIYIEKIQQVMKNKKKLEHELSVKISNRGMNIFIEGSGENEFLALKVLEAINIGFSIKRALLLKDPNIILNIINIKNSTKRKNLYDIKGRLIGPNGKTLKTLNELTDCAISLNENNVGIIGDSEFIKETIQAVNSIIQGSKHGNVYARLEREKKKRRLNPVYFQDIRDESRKEEESLI